MTIKKRKLKKKPLYILIGILLFIIIIIIIVKLIVSINIKRNSNEYKLKNIGYKEDEISEILDLDEKYIEYLIKSDYNPIAYKLIEEKYFIEDNMDSYLKYYEENKNENLSTIVSLVNVGQNEKNYENFKSSNIDDDELILINKHTKLDKDIEYDDLVEVKNWYCYGTNYLREDAYNAFIDLYNDAKEDDLNILIKLSYRSYVDQELIWENQGGDDDDTTISRPGFSDYQSGYSIDITLDEDGDILNWMNDNAYKYGFILRYPSDKVNITGYEGNDAHWRYVGTKAAKVIHDENITFDEYYAYYVENK